MMPALVVFGLFFLLPVYYAIALSFQSWNGLSPIETATWVGLANYKSLLGDRIFLDSVYNTVILTFGTTVLRTVLAFLLAFGLWYYGRRFVTVQRLVIFVPTVLAMVLVGLLWQQALARTGPINSLFGTAIPWFGDPAIVLAPVVWMGIWQWTGWSMIIYLAAMVGMPREVIEAARVDGASDGRIAWNIVRPLVGHATALVVLLNIIGAAQTFDTIHVTTRGGPDHGSETMTTFAYWAALDGSGPGEFGLASAASCIIIAVLMVVAVARLRMVRDVD
jgi:ABC-type sugar transport system permease subunit